MERYAVYYGAEIAYYGTLSECSEYLGISEELVLHYSTPEERIKSLESPDADTVMFIIPESSSAIDRYLIYRSGSREVLGSSYDLTKAKMILIDFFTQDDEINFYIVDIEEKEIVYGVE